MGKIADGVIFGQRRGLGAPDFLQITLRLLFGLGQVFVGGFVFGKEDALPKYIDELGVVGRVFDGVFEVGKVLKEIVALENGAVVGKKEEKQARDEEAQLVFFVNAFFFERVVQPADAGVL